MQVGGFVYPFHEWSTPKAEMEKRLGYQKDPKAAIQEAKKLMAAAGHPNGLKNLDFVVRDIASFKLWAVAIQAMLKENLNIETNLRVVQTSQWFEEAASGNFDLAISAIVSSLMDPSDYFTAWYGKGGPQNYSGWTNEQFHSLAHNLEREVDENKRKAMIPQGRGDPRERSAARPGGLRADLRRLLQPGAWPERDEVLRHLRRHALGHGLDGAVLGRFRARAEVPAPAGRCSRSAP